MSWQPGLFAAGLSAAGLGLAVAEQPLWSEGAFLVQAGLLGWVLAFGLGTAWQRLLVVWLLAVVPVWLLAWLVGSGFEMLSPSFSWFRGQAIFLTTLVTAASLLLCDWCCRLAPEWHPQPSLASERPFLPEPARPGPMPLESGAVATANATELEAAATNRTAVLTAKRKEPSVTSRGKSPRHQWSMGDWAMLLVLVSISLALAQMQVDRAWLLAKTLDLPEQTSPSSYWLLLLRQFGWLALLAIANSLAILAPLSLACKRRSPRSSSGLIFVRQTVCVAGVISSLLLLFVPLGVGLELVGMIVAAATVAAVFLLCSGAYLDPLAPAERTAAAQG